MLAWAQTFNYTLFKNHFNNQSPTDLTTPIPKWDITHYNDQFNILPTLGGFTLMKDINHPFWSSVFFGYQPSSITMDNILNQATTTVTLNGRKLYANANRHGNEFPLPFYIDNPINVSSAKANQSKFYIEWLFTKNYDHGGAGIGFFSSNRARYDAYHDQYGYVQYSGFAGKFLDMFRLWGQANPSQLQLYSYDSAGVITVGLSGPVYQPELTGQPKRVGIGLEYNSNNVKYSLYFTYNNYGAFDPNNTAMTLCHTFTLNYNDYNVSREGDTVMPGVYQYADVYAAEFEYVQEGSASIPVGHTYLK